MKKVIIFDFDGTIADTYTLVKDLLQHLSKEFRYKNPTDAEIALLRTQHPKVVMKKLGISPFKLPFLLFRVKRAMHKHILEIKPIPGMEKALLELKSHDYKLGIVTSNSENNVKDFLKKNDIAHFDFIQTGSSIFGKSRVLNTVLKKHKIDRQDAIYVGDEIRDIEAAQKVGIKMIAVSWGFNGKEGLAKFHPDALIDKPSELLSKTLSK